MLVALGSLKGRVGETIKDLSFRGVGNFLNGELIE